MRATLFSWDANPSVDKPYRINFNQILDLVKAKRADKIAHLDQRGQPCYQMRPPAELIEKDQRSLVGGWGFGSAWKIIPSGGMPVWQMPSVRSAITT